MENLQENNNNNNTKTSSSISQDGESTKFQAGTIIAVRRSSSITSRISIIRQQQQSATTTPAASDNQPARRSRSLENFFGAPSSPSSVENVIAAFYQPEASLMNNKFGHDDDKTDDEPHECLPFEDDPLVGIIIRDAAASAPGEDDLDEAINSNSGEFLLLSHQHHNQACCPTMAYLKLQSTPHRGMKTRLTPFGRRMHTMNMRRGYRLNTLLSAMLTWTAAERCRRLKTNFRLLDPERVEWCFDQCSICLAACRFVKRPPCCREKAICQLCWQSYVKQTAENNTIRLNIVGSYDLRCFSCNKFVPYNEALTCTSSEDMNLIRPPGKLTSPAVRCPVCLDIVNQPQVDDNKRAVKKLWQKKGGKPFQCVRCQHHFCGTCGLADHPHLTCKQLTTTDIGLDKWAHQKHRNRPEFPNCRRCPRCSIPLSHSGGCPHMTCICGAEFCYSCGRRYGFEFVHQIHMSEQFRLLPFVSCTKLWQSKQKRLLVHSLISLGLIFGVIPLTIALAPVAGPVAMGLYLAYRK